MNFITVLVFKNLQLSEIQNVLLGKINKNSLSVVELGTGRCTTPTNEIFSFFLHSTEAFKKKRRCGFCYSLFHRAA
jgi:hypothetical protein